MIIVVIVFNLYLRKLMLIYALKNIPIEELWFLVQTRKQFD